MIGESKSKEVRNAMLAVVVVVLLGLVGCAKPNGGANGPAKPDPSDVIQLRVLKEPLPIPEQLGTVLKALDAESILVINHKNEAVAFSVEGGVPRDLCEPSSKSSDYGSGTCSVELPSGDLMMILGASAANNPCSTCSAGGLVRSCRKSSDMVTCSSQVEDCDTGC